MIIVKRIDRCLNTQIIETGKTLDIPSFRKILCYLKNKFLLQLNTFRNTHVLQFYNIHHVHDLFMIRFGKVNCENQAIYCDIFTFFIFLCLFKFFSMRHYSALLHFGDCYPRSGHFLGFRMA